MPPPSAALLDTSASLDTSSLDASASADSSARQRRDQRSQELLALLARTQDQQQAGRLRESVVLLNLPLASSVAARFRDRGESQEDLVQVARVGLIKAVDRFDPGLGDSFVAYAVPTIQGELRRHFRDLAWDIRPPRRVQDLRQRVDQTAERLTRALARTPRPSEVAAELGVDPEAVEEALASRDLFHVASLDQAEPGPDEPGRPDPALDLLVDVLSVGPALRRLPERERRVLALRFAADWTQSRIAAEIGVTQMQVSRLISRSLQQARREVERASTAAVRSSAAEPPSTVRTTPGRTARSAPRPPTTPRTPSRSTARPGTPRPPAGGCPPPPPAP